MSTKQTFFFRIHWQNCPNGDAVKFVKDTGIEIISYEHIGIADCTIFEVAKLPDPMPEHWIKIDRPPKDVGTFHN